MSLSFPAQPSDRSHPSAARARQGEIRPIGRPSFGIVSDAGATNSELRVPDFRQDGILEKGPKGDAARLLGDLWHISRAIHDDPTLRLHTATLAMLESVTHDFKSELSTYTPLQAVRGVTSLANIGYRDLDLFKRLHEHLRGKVSELSAIAIADVAWSCGRLVVQDMPLLDTLKKMALRKVRTARVSDRENTRGVISFKERALMSWGFAVACQEDKGQDFVKQFAHPMDLERSSGSLNHWHLMYQALVITDILEGKEQFPQLKSIEARTDDRALNHFEMSVLHSAMSLLGEDRCTYHIHERMAGVEADLVIRAPEGSVIIESDGEAFHRLIGPDGGVPQGKDRGQDLFFKKLGVKAVIHVGSKEWDPRWGEDILRQKIATSASFLLDRP